MSRRTYRARAEILEVSKTDCWLVVDDPWRRIIRSEKLSAGTDLMGRFLEELLAYHDKGWRLQAFTSEWAYFFATKDGTKHHVQITVDDPSIPKLVSGSYGSRPTYELRKRIDE
jgi:hypothetical protein